MADIWVCERKKDKSGKTIFKPIGRAEKTKKETPEFVVIEKGNSIELNEIIANLSKDGFELFEIENKTHNEFFSSFIATMVNYKNNKHKFREFKNESAISRAIH